jgi:hypothetical protein
LNGRAFYGAIGAVYATISLPWLQYYFTVFALVEERTSILWHGFFFGEPTLRTGYGGFELYCFHCANKFTTNRLNTSVHSLWVKIRSPINGYNSMP